MPQVISKVIAPLLLMGLGLLISAPASGGAPAPATDQVAEPDTLHVPMGIGSRPENGAVRLTLAARFQNYDKDPTHPLDRRDKWIQSPKSVRFSPDGSRVYVNSLEGFMTHIYDPVRLIKLGDIEHSFDSGDAPLFRGESSVFDYRYYEFPDSGDVNCFQGKPVESVFSHGGRYLWISYYRRDFDKWGRSPSALAIIDTATGGIVRVLPTGPIPKILTVSPDGSLLAVTHWGDNTVALIDISSDDPTRFRYLPERLVVEEILRQDELVEQSRDGACGFCLRGTVFTPDGKVLLVGRMGGGGIAGFEVDGGRYLGTVTGMQPTPRHLLIDPDGRRLYLSSNRTGYVSSIELDQLLSVLMGAHGGKVELDGWLETEVGKWARTIALTPDRRLLLVTVFGDSELVVLDADTLTILARINVDSFPVGLAISPDGKRVWTTSQGRNLQGGNSICIFDLQY